ncbi:MlaD family protein [Vibrio sp. YIC-376]|uniref:MlaD family protein n=1 Tax=Vibrio sp. YIC-376 TaxID=3136162 RepID=UPI00402A9D07
MDDSKSNFRLGLFVVSTLICLFIILFILGGQSMFKPKLMVETYFDSSVSGLAVGSPVRYRGIPVGEVVAIELSDTLYENSVERESRKSYVVVRSEITGPKRAIKEWNRNIEVYVDRGLRAQTQLAGITGQQFLSFDYVSSTENLSFDWTPEVPYIPSTRSSAGKIVSGVNKLIETLDEANIQRLSENLNALVVNIDKSLKAMDVSNMSQELTSLVVNVNKLVKDIDDLVASSDVRNSITSISNVTSKLDKSLGDKGEISQLIQDMDRVAQRLDVMMDDNQYDINYMIKDLRATAENLKNFSGTLKNQPSSIIFSTEPEKLKINKE